MTTLPHEIFKAYDIRGIVGKTLTAPIVEVIGRSIGSELLERGRDTLGIGRAGRLSGPELSAALARAAGHDDYPPAGFPAVCTSAVGGGPDGSRRACRPHRAA